MLRLPIAAMVLCLATASAVAEDIDPDKAAAIRRLLEVTGAEVNRTELTRSFTQQLVSVLQANKTSLTPDSIEIIRGEVSQVVDEQMTRGVLQNKMYRIYARYFTLEEIEGLIQFNQSDIGKKANRVMPILMRESMAAAQEWSEEIGPALSKRVSARLRDEGIRIGQ